MVCKQRDPDNTTTRTRKTAAPANKKYRIKRVRVRRFFFWFIRVFIAPFLKRSYRYRCECRHLSKGPHLILSNHVTNLDPVWVGCGFDNSLYYVASEHLSRLGFLSKIIDFFFAPILRNKAATELKTAKEILRVLGAGENVCMFAEGSSTWNGETGEIVPSTPKLVKRSGVPLITFRLQGGYLTDPRWGHGVRRGRMTGAVVHEYSAQELAAMSVEQIDAAIRRDIYENAFETNADRQITYRCKAPAENLETALFICPRCGRLATLLGHDDIFECGCGYQVTLNQQGRFEPRENADPFFPTVLDWDRWQRAELHRRAETLRALPRDQVIVSDEGQTLSSYTYGKKTTPIGTGRLRLFCDRLEFTASDGSDKTIPIAEINDMALIKQGMLLIADRDQYYQVKTDHPRSSLKYLLLCSELGSMQVII